VADLTENDTPPVDDARTVKDFTVPPRRQPHTRAEVAADSRKLEGTLSEALGFAGMAESMRQDLMKTTGVTSLVGRLEADLKASGAMEAIKASVSMAAVTGDLSKSLGWDDEGELGARLFPGLDRSHLPTSTHAHDSALVQVANLPTVPPNPTFEVLEVLRAERQDRQWERELAAKELAVEKRKRVRREAEDRVRALNQRRKHRLNTAGQVVLGAIAIASATSGIVSFLIEL